MIRWTDGTVSGRSKSSLGDALKRLDIVIEAHGHCYAHTFCYPALPNHRTRGRDKPAHVCDCNGIDEVQTLPRLIYLRLSDCLRLLLSVGKQSAYLEFAFGGRTHATDVLKSAGASAMLWVSC